MAAEDLVLFPEDTTPYAPVGVITVGAPDLLRALAAVIHAASTDDARPILASVAIEPREVSETVRLVASDNYRIAMCQVDAETDAAGDWGAPVPAATEDVKRLVAVLKSIPDIRAEDCPARVVLTLGRRDSDYRSTRLDAFIDAEGTPVARLPLRVIDGVYPDVMRVVPRAPEPVATFTGLYLSEAAKFAGAFGEAGIVTQARSGTAEGPFVFRAGAYTEVVMPVRTDAERPASPTHVADLVTAVVEATVDAAASGELGEDVTVTRDVSRFAGLVLPDESLDQAYARLERRGDFTEVIESDAGQLLLRELAQQREIRRRTVRRGGRDVDPETGEILDGAE